jgi:hypothetical protein
VANPNEPAPEGFEQQVDAILSLVEAGNSGMTLVRKWLSIDLKPLPETLPETQL